MSAVDYHRLALDEHASPVTAARWRNGTNKYLKYIVGSLLIGALTIHLAPVPDALLQLHTSSYHERVAERYWPNQKWSPMADSVYANFSPSDQDSTKRDSSCARWVPGSREGTKCWRAKPYDQLQAFLISELPETLNWGGRPEHDSVAALRHLRDCLADVAGRLKCSKNVYKVMASAYHYLNVGMKDVPLPSGEVVWTNSYVKTMKNLGFTLLAANSYPAMVQLHRAIPDVITVIWAEDIKVMTCLNDPRCVKDMRPTQAMYPDLGFKGDRPMWGWQSTDGRRGNKWIWTQEELNNLPKEELGTIPAHKLFAATVWGSRPGDGFFDLPTTHQFTFNNLGNHWTASSFQYPDHTYMPFSVAYTCLEAPAAEKKGQLFVLGKDTAYFYERTAPNPDSWVSITSETGLDIVCASADHNNGPHYELPAGVRTTGRLSAVEFAALMGESKAMIAIGNPTISPSPYEALCQGTPVLMPYYRNLTDDPWFVFSSDYSQHGPAIQLGEPYVYAYRSGDVEDLTRQILKAVANPIERYIPQEMTIEGLAERIQWFMYFDWEALATAIDHSQNHVYPVTQAYVVGRCFDLLRCQPFVV